MKQKQFFIILFWYFVFMVLNAFLIPFFFGLFLETEDLTRHETSVCVCFLVRFVSQRMIECGTESASYFPELLIPQMCSKIWWCLKSKNLRKIGFFSADIMQNCLNPNQLKCLLMLSNLPNSKGFHNFGLELTTKLKKENLFIQVMVVP